MRKHFLKFTKEYIIGLLTLMFLDLLFDQKINILADLIIVLVVVSGIFLLQINASKNRN